MIITKQNQELIPNLTLTDIVASTTRDQSNKAFLQTASTLCEFSEMLNDIPWIEANGDDHHETTLQPITKENANNHRVAVQVYYEHLIREAFIKDEIININKTDRLWRSSEERPILEQLSHEFEKMLFDCEHNFSGFSKNFSTLSDRFNSAKNIIDAGGREGDLTSIWLVGWSPNTCHCVYPRNTSAGLTIDDNGPVYILSHGYKTTYSWKYSFILRDWRYVVRIANIQKSLLHPIAPDVNSHEKGHNLYELMLRAQSLVPTLAGARFAFYGNRDVETYLRLQCANTRSILVHQETKDQRIVTMFDGIPFRRVDALAWGEQQVK